MTTTTMANSSSSSNNEAEASSMSSFRVALLQFPVTDEKAVNLQTCAKYIDDAMSKKPNLLVLPEIWNSPYATSAFPEYAEILPTPSSVLEDQQQSDELSSSESVQLLRNKAIEHKVWIVGGSIPEIDDDDDDKKKIYNTCLVYNDKGGLVAKHRKIHLFDVNVPNGIRFFESETLSPGSQFTHFATPWCNIGLGICYDIRFPEYAMVLAKEFGCKVLIYPGAFNMTTGPAHWELLQRGRAVDTQCYVMMASPARSTEEESPTNDGKQQQAQSQRKPKKKKYPHYTAWGHSTVVAPWGDILATIDEKEGIVVADLDLQNVSDMRQSIPVYQQKRNDLYHLSSSSSSSDNAQQQPQQQEK